MSVPEISTEDEGAGLARLILFSDAVFAIVITLLVLPITVDVDFPATGGSMAQQTWDMWPRIVSFVISFLVIGQFWIAHHRMYGRLARHDDNLLKLNLLALLTIAFLPFPTALLGIAEGTDQRFVAVLYAASMALASLALTSTWIYAHRFGDLVRVSQTRRERHDVTVGSATTTAVFVGSIGVAYVSLTAAIITWVVVLPLIRRLVMRRSARRAA